MVGVVAEGFVDFVGTHSEGRLFRDGEGIVEREASKVRKVRYFGG